MKTLVLVLVFIGLILIVQGYYDNRLKKIENKKTVIKYLPLNIFEDRMSGSEMIDYQFKSQFEKITNKDS